MKKLSQRRLMPIQRLVSGALLTLVLPVSAAELSQTELFFELNNSAGDLGFHGNIDGGPYVELEIHDPNELTIGRLGAYGRLAKQGLTQLAFESAEPPFSQLSPRAFLKRFPEGEYEIVAETAAGEILEGEVTLSHVMANVASNITVAGVRAAPNCDSPVLPVVSEPVVIHWDPVTTSHPTIGKRGPVIIDKYQFFVEREGVKLAVDLPPDVTEFEVPSSILALGDSFKFEIIARTSTGNNTATESCFLVQ
jgi:hypothetical protein